MSYRMRGFDAALTREYVRSMLLKATARKRLKVIYAVMRDVRPYEPR